MAKEDAGNVASYYDEAKKVLSAIGGTVSSGTPTEDVAGAVVGVGYALLAIHDELRAIRSKERPEDKPAPLADRKATVSTLQI